MLIIYSIALQRTTHSSHNVCFTQRLFHLSLPNIHCSTFYTVRYSSLIFICSLWKKLNGFSTIVTYLKVFLKSFKQDYVYLILHWLNMYYWCCFHWKSDSPTLFRFLFLRTSHNFYWQYLLFIIPSSFLFLMTNFHRLKKNLLWSHASPIVLHKCSWPEIKLHYWALRLDECMKGKVRWGFIVVMMLESQDLGSKNQRSISCR